MTDAAWYFDPAPRVSREELTLKPEDLIMSGHCRADRDDRPTLFMLRDMGEAGVGLEFDRYSLPWVLRRFQPKNAALWGPSALHDDRLIRAGLLGLPRRKIDQMLTRDMRAVGIDWHWRWLTYAGVRAGSWGGYKRPERENMPYMSVMCQAPDITDRGRYFEWMADTRGERENFAAARIVQRRAAAGLVTRADSIGDIRRMAASDEFAWAFETERRPA